MISKLFINKICLRVLHSHIWTLKCHTPYNVPYNMCTQYTVLRVLRTDCYKAKFRSHYMVIY